MGGDPENPPCARLVLSGDIIKVTNTSEEKEAKASLFARHPSFKLYPPGHSFFVAKMVIDEIWLISAYGGAAIITPTEYYAANALASASPPTNEYVKGAVAGPPNPS